MSDPDAIGERRLVAAVLALALDDLRGPMRFAADHEAREVRESARRWLAGGDARITFDEACAFLRLDGDAVRMEVAGKTGSVRRSIGQEI